MIEIKNLKSNNPDLNIDHLFINQNTVVIGPSGAGKSTLLRCIAGVQEYSGQIYINGDLKIKPGPTRDVSIAWQDGRLLPNLTVRKNIELGGNVDFINRVASFLKIDYLLNKMPHEISGGEAQRVNIARSLCSNSSVLLLDEPMQGIDPIVSRKMIKNILRESKNLKKLVVMVSHELYQIYGSFDNAVVVKSGAVVDYGRMVDLYDMPSSPWLANFFGPYSVLDGDDLKCFDLHSNENPCMVRPEWFKIKVAPFKTKKEFNSTVIGVSWNGPSNRISLELDSTKKHITVDTYTDYKINKGDRVYVNFKKSSNPIWINSSSSN